MRIITDNILPSDCIAYSLNQSGNMPGNLTRPHPHVRVSLSVNTFYPEVFGRYYLNWRVLRVIDSALESVGIWITDDECVSSNGTDVIPVQCIVSLDMDVAYALRLANGDVIGALLKWSFTTGGGGAFFSDNLIVDMLAEPVYGQRIISSLGSGCSQHSVKLVDHDAMGPL